MGIKQSTYELNFVIDVSGYVNLQVQQTRLASLLA